MAVTPRRRPGLAFALWAPPVAWFGSQSLSYVLVPRVCAAGDAWLLHATALLALGLTVLGGLGGRRAQGAGSSASARLLGTIATLAAGLFGLIIIAQWLATLLVHPCQTAPRHPDAPDARRPGRTLQLPEAA